MLNILAALLLLEVLVAVHELGHFIVARRTGIGVHEFAFGMGPRIAARRWGETLFTLRVLPFGGYVRMASDLDPAAEATAEPDRRPDTRASSSHTFESRKVGARAATIAGGPAASLTLSVLMLVLIFSVVGMDQPVLSTTVLGDVLAEGPAYAAGLRPGDRVVSIDGLQVGDWASMVALVQAALGRPISLVYERDGQNTQVSLTPEPHPQDPAVGYLGVATQVVRVHLSVPQAVTTAFSETGRFLTLWIGAIVGIIRGQGAPDVSGPIGIIQMFGEASRFGLANFLYLGAILSANFALLQLLPVPGLDGGQLLFMGVEAVRGKPVSPEQYSRVHTLGYVLLMGLLFLLTYRDLARLWGGG